MTFGTNIFSFIELRNQLLVLIPPSKLFYFNYRIIYRDMRRCLFMLFSVHFQHLNFLTVAWYERVQGVSTQLHIDFWVLTTKILNIRIKWLLKPLDLLTDILTILNWLLHLKRL